MQGIQKSIVHTPDAIPNFNYDIQIQQKNKKPMALVR
jgi:hypothetical protein